MWVCSRGCHVNSFVTYCVRLMWVGCRFIAGLLRNGLDERKRAGCLNNEKPLGLVFVVSIERRD